MVDAALSEEEVADPNMEEKRSRKAALFIPKGAEVILFSEALHYNRMYPLHLEGSLSFALKDALPPNSSVLARSLRLQARAILESRVAKRRVFALLGWLQRMHRPPVSTEHCPMDWRESRILEIDELKIVTVFSVLLQVRRDRRDRGYDAHPAPVPGLGRFKPISGRAGGVQVTATGEVPAAWFFPDEAVREDPSCFHEEMRRKNPWRCSRVSLDLYGPSDL